MLPRKISRNSQRETLGEGPPLIVPGLESTFVVLAGLKPELRRRTSALGLMDQWGKSHQTDGALAFALPAIENRIQLEKRAFRKNITLI